MSNILHFDKKIKEIFEKYSALDEDIEKAYEEYLTSIAKMEEALSNADLAVSNAKRAEQVLNRLLDTANKQ